MLLKFAGVGSAFAPRDFYQTNAVIQEHEDGDALLIDCGSDARFSLKDLLIELDQIAGVYITHLHADHIGGLEWLALNTYFNPMLKRPKLIAIRELMGELWRNSLRGGLETLQGQLATITTFFDCQPLSPNEPFMWGDIRFQPVQTVHVVSGFKIQYSYGLLIDTDPDKEELQRTSPPKTKVFFTGDTQFCPKQIETFYEQAGTIFHDCETTEFQSGVHAHFDDLCTLPDDIKARMWLMHYDPNGKVTDADALKAGFRGFVKRGQKFEF
jgi:ribonuclease BN (tRNA processing enzyme)